MGQKNIFIIGLQWGDEGKGKVVDALSTYAKCVVRCQGGNNAGHTLVLNNRKIVLHTLPSGVLHNHVINIIANGVVLSLTSLLEEVKNLNTLGFTSLMKRIFISESCSLIFPYHIFMDIAREKKFKKNVIGTTKRGIGPAYEDKIARRGFRIENLLDKENFSIQLKEVIDFYNFQLEKYFFFKTVSFDAILDEIFYAYEFFSKRIIDVTKMINSFEKNYPIIFEGAQGSLLDIDHGSYPYVTSSNTVFGGMLTGSGINIKNGYFVLGIVKSYMTRVGYGPFPTEIFDEMGKFSCIQETEFGSTTGRRRRIGWFDAVLVRRSIQINCVSSLCLTKLDILDKLPEIKICVSYYNLDEKEEETIFSLTKNKLSKIQPIYETLPGWETNTFGIKKFNMLPRNAQNYVKRIEELIDLRIDAISTGPGREDLIIMQNPFDFL